MQHERLDRLFLHSLSRVIPPRKKTKEKQKNCKHKSKNNLIRVENTELGTWKNALFCKKHNSAQAVILWRQKCGDRGWIRRERCLSLCESIWLNAYSYTLSRKHSDRALENNKINYRIASCYTIYCFLYSFFDLNTVCIVSCPLV